MHTAWEEILEIREVFRGAYLEYWLNYNLFSFPWWVIVVMNLLVFYVAWKMLSRTRLFELLTLGGLTVIVSTLLDIITVQYGLTGYPNSLFPISPSLFLGSFTMIPVIYMLIYQYFSTWRSYITAMIVVSVILSFVVENFLRWLNIYQYINWNSIYSLIVYIAMAILLKWIMACLSQAQK